MAVPKPQWNPVRSPRGKIAHAATYSNPGRTACGKRMRGWKMCLNDILSCDDCKLAIGYDCRPRHCPPARRPRRRRRNRR